MITADVIALGRRLLNEGKAAEAQQVAERMLAQSPAHEEAWIVLVDSWMARRSPGQAADAARRALFATPRSERLQARLMMCQLHNGDLAAANAALETLSAASTSDVEALTMLGQVGAALERHDLARAAFERASAIRPGDPQLLFNLATSLRNFGEFARAETLYDQVIRMRPEDWEAFKNRSELRRQTPARNHLPELLAAVPRAARDWRGAVMISYALGKEYEDLGQDDLAFQAYDAGARLRRRHTTYNVEADLQRIDRIRATFTGEWMGTRSAGFPGSGPIFIFGLPRAGSTLLERMLGAHSEVFAAGELQDFGIAVMTRASSSGSAVADLIGQSADLDLHELGKAYMTSATVRVGKSPFFIDKLPGNFLYAGLIAAALPNAKMIHIHRDPRDAGFAIYKTLFKQAYPFSYDLAEAGRYIRGYQRLMDHWRAVLPGRVCDVSYERLVLDPEEVLRTVLAHCGLAFEPNCLSYEGSAQASSTASAVQVRQPIYQSSVGAWRRYERYLGPLCGALGSDDPGISPRNRVANPRDPPGAPRAGDLSSTAATSGQA